MRMLDLNFLIHFAFCSLVLALVLTLSHMDCSDEYTVQILVPSCV